MRGVRFLSLEPLKEKLAQLEMNLEKMQLEVKNNLIKNNKQSLTDHIYCYFTHSIILNYIQGKNHFIMGNFHIKNVSSKIIHSPLILLKINSKSEFNFTGKYKSTNQESKGYNFLWERVILEDFDPMTHYCFKPTQKDTLNRNELLSFQNFQLIFPTDTAVQIEGFTYFDQNNDGIPAINSIEINV